MTTREWAGRDIVTGRRMVRCSHCGLGIVLSGNSDPGECPKCGKCEPAPRTGEDVAAMMREAWPGPDWTAGVSGRSDPCGEAVSGRFWLCVAFNRDRGYMPRVLVYDDHCRHPLDDRGWFADFPAAVSALRAAHARLLADLRALAPGEEDASEEAMRSATIAACDEIGRLRAEVERLTRVQDGAREESGKLREALALAGGARDKAADVAREAIRIVRLVAKDLRHTGERTLPHDSAVEAAEEYVEIAARLTAELAALTSVPAPPADPLEGLPDNVAQAVRDVAAGTFGGVETLGWYVEIVGPPGTDFVLAWDKDDHLQRLLRVSPDGAITRDATP
jgi:hypothetical protein